MLDELENQLMTTLLSSNKSDFGFYNSIELLLSLLTFML